jgi:hypothetical protein
MALDSGIGTRSGAGLRFGIGGISMLEVGSAVAAGSSAGGSSEDMGDDAGEDTGSCGACIRENGVMGIGARPGPAMPVPGGGD